jgi:hypothetical protein
MISVADNSVMSVYGKRRRLQALFEATDYTGKLEAALGFRCRPRAIVMKPYNISNTTINIRNIQSGTMGRCSHPAETD